MSKLEARKGRSKEISLIVCILLFFTLLSSFVFGLAYAPITIHGRLTFEGTPFVDAEVGIQIIENQSTSFSKKTFSNEQGEFIFVITVKDSNTPLDLQITTKTTETYVDIIKNALPWNTYSVDIRLENDEYVEVKVSSSVRDSNLEFDADMQKIISGEVLEDPDLIEEFKEKYGMEIVSLDEEKKQTEEKIPPILEEPKYIPAPSASEEIKNANLQHKFLEILAIFVIVLCIFLVRHETKH